jgi:hypothetical protein
MRRIFSVLALIALLTVVAMPAMADQRGDGNDWGNNNWGNHDDCDWGCDHNDFDRFDHSQPFFNPSFTNSFSNNDCEWEFEEGWFWGFWGWQWGVWVLDC